MQIKDILQYNQPYVLYKLNKRFKFNSTDKKEKQPEVQPEHFSFSDVDKLMRERSDVNESRCKGR